jgi:hypothetical protein
MTEDKSQLDADGYYGEEEIEGGDIDLSFLDEDKDK